MNWGHRLIILYVGFILLIGTMVYLSSRENVDLVSSDYYDQEIKFQSKMEAESNARPYEDSIKVNLNGDLVQVQFPSTIAENAPKGQLKLYRSSDAKFDYSTDLNLQAGGAQTIHSPNIKRGDYILQMSWTMEGKPYYCEQHIFMK